MNSAGLCFQTLEFRFELQRLIIIIFRVVCYRTREERGCARKQGSTSL